MTIVLLAVGLFGGSAAAQSLPATGTAVMTVDELVAQALADNLELQAARAELGAAVGRVRQAGLRPNPTLDLGFQKALGPDNNLMVGVTLPLDLNGRKAGRVGVAERELDLKRAQLAARARRLRAEVRMKAGEVLAVRRTLATTEALLAANRRALELVRNRVREGAAPQIDENFQLLEVNRLEAAAVAQRGRLEVFGLQLRAVAGLAAGPPLELAGDLASAPVGLDAGVAVQEALTRRPDAAVARAEAATAAARVRKEEAEARWDASVNVGYQRQDFGFDLMGITEGGARRPIQDVFHYFGTGVTITLPVRNRNQGNIAAARAETRAAERRQELTDLTIRQEIAAAFAQDAAARRAVDLYERGVRPVAGRNLDVVRQAYELGRGSLLDVIAEQRRFLEVETGYTDALKQVYDAGVEIERALGRSVR